MRERIEIVPAEKYTKRYALAIIARAQQPQLVEETVMTMLENWMRTRLGTVKVETITAYKKYLRRYFTRKREEEEKGNVRYTLPAFMEELGKRVKKKEVGYSTYNVCLAAVRNVAEMMLEYGERVGKKNIDPAALMSWRAQWEEVVEMLPMKKPKGRRAGRWLSKGEVEKVLNSIDRDTLSGKRDAALIALLIGAGLRRNEIVGLKKGQVKGNWNGRAMIVGLQGKGNSLDDVAMPSWAWLLVEDWARRAGLRDDDWLMCEVRGEMAVVKGGREGERGKGGISGEMIRKIVGRVSEDSGVGRIRPHDGRRTCGGLIVETGGGGGLRQAQMQLRHSNITTTARYIGAGLELRPGLAGVDKAGEGLNVGLGTGDPAVKRKLGEKLKAVGVKVVGRRKGKGEKQGERIWGKVRRRVSNDPVEELRASHRGRRMWVKKRLRQLGYEKEGE